MNKSILLILAFLLIQLENYSQPCLPNGIILTNQDEIDNFQTNYPNCTEIEGKLTIGGYGCNITNLNGLDVLTSIGDTLFIYGINNLNSLSGLHNITYIGGNFEIFGNPNLANFTGLEGLIAIEGDFINGYYNYTVNGNPNLTSFTGLDSLLGIGGDLRIVGNDALHDLTGLGNLDLIGGDLIIVGNDTLTSLMGLGSLAYIGGSIRIGVGVMYGNGGNQSLMSLTGLENLYAIPGDLDLVGNASLIDLTGLENLTSIGGTLRIGQNISSYFSGGNLLLNDITALNNLTSLGGGLSIESNQALSSLTGLNMSSIGGSLTISNNGNLTNLSVLNDLTSIGGDLYIHDNWSLTSLTGLDNIDPSSINSMHIYQNHSLSTCEVQSVCDYLSSYYLLCEIYSNAPGCMNRPEVEAACETVSTREIPFEECLVISPNPCSGSITIQYTINENGITNIDLYEMSGVKIIQLLRREQMPGTYKTECDLSTLPTGIYIITLQIENGFQTSKIIKQ